MVRTYSMCSTHSTHSTHSAGAPASGSHTPMKRPAKSRPMLPCHTARHTSQLPSTPAGRARGAGASVRRSVGAHAAQPASPARNPLFWRTLHLAPLPLIPKLPTLSPAPHPPCHSPLNSTAPQPVCSTFFSASSTIKSPRPAGLVHTWRQQDKGMLWASESTMVAVQLALCVKGTMQCMDLHACKECPAGK